MLAGRDYVKRLRASAGQPHPNRFQRCALADHPCAGRGEARVNRHGVTCKIRACDMGVLDISTLEIGAVAAFEIGFHGQVLGEDHVMLCQFNMPVGEMLQG